MKGKCTMKKNRNTFFQESSFYNQAGMPTPNMNVANQPFTMESYANQSFYAGPSNGIPQNYNIPNGNNANTNNYDYSSDIESRLSKIERQINRLDARLNKLESGTIYSSDDIETTNNIYMI